MDARARHRSVRQTGCSRRHAIEGGFQARGDQRTGQADKAGHVRGRSGCSQYVAPLVGAGGKVLALDLLDMDPIPGVEFIQGDFREQSVLQQLEQALQGRRVDLVLSDMAPNISGVRVTDQARWAHLSELAVEFAKSHLQPGGALLVKCFEGCGVDELRREVGALFESISVRKPKASRDRSREFFLLAKGLRNGGGREAQQGETV